MSRRIRASVSRIWRLAHPGCAIPKHGRPAPDPGHRAGRICSPRDRLSGRSCRSLSPSRPERVRGPARAATACSDGTGGHRPGDRPWGRPAPLRPALRRQEGPLPPPGRSACGNGRQRVPRSCRQRKAASLPAGGCSSICNVQAKRTCVPRRARIAPPTRPKPASIIAQEAGSGAGAPGTKGAML